jgi:hypothetical protein
VNKIWTDFERWQPDTDPPDQRPANTGLREQSDMSDRRLSIRPWEPLVFDSDTLVQAPMAGLGTGERENVE